MALPLGALGRLAAIVTILLMASFGNASSAAALTEVIPVNVAVVLCTDDTCDTFGDRVGDITISAVDTTSSVTFATCVTDLASQTQGCVLNIPVDADYILEWSATPDGYTFFGSTIDVSNEPGPPVTFIPFVPSVIETETILVNAALCTDLGCLEFSDTLVGFEITAYNEDTLEPIDSCLTDPGSQGNICELEIPMATTWYLDFDPATVPAGYTFADVIVSDGEMGPIVHTLAFRPDAPPATEIPTQAPTVAPTETATPATTPTAAAVTTLPTTGTGPDPDGGTATTSVIVLGSGLLIAATVLASSRKLSQR